jgi:hypothetical protein
LTSLWLLDEVGPWLGGMDHFARLKQAPKHYLADPALAMTLLDISREDLLIGAARTAFDKRFGTIGCAPVWLISPRGIQNRR